MHTFYEALSGGGNPAGIIVGGQPLSSYEQNSSGQYGLWSLIKYMDSSTESPNLKTEGGTMATLYVVAVFKPLSSLFGKGAQQTQTEPNTQGGGLQAGGPPSYTPPPQDGLPGFPDAERMAQQGGPITMTVGNTPTGTAYVRGYPNDVRDEQGLGIIYQVPTYDLTVSGTDANGNAVSRNFTVLRYGVYNNKNGPSVVGVNSGTYNLTWGTMSQLGQALHVDGAGNGKVWVHAGPVYLDRPVGANGCVELCGPGAWTGFKTFVGGLGNGPMTITFMPAVAPPLQVVPGKRY